MTHSDGVMLGRDEGHRIVGGAIDVTIKVTSDYPAFASTFEIRVPPGYDVGAHVHASGEEVFYVVKGTLDILAFEPLDRTIPDWHEWRSVDGKRYLRGGPGAFLYVPPGCPHAFGNPTDEETLVFFQSSVPGGHENYFVELAALLKESAGRPDQAAMLKLRNRYGILQLTTLQTKR